MMRRGRLCRRLASLLLWVVMAPPLMAAPPQYSIHPSGAEVTADQSRRVALSVAEDAPVDILLARTAGAAAGVDLVLAPFRDKQGNSLVVKFKDPSGKGPPQTELHDVLATRPLLALHLVVPPMTLPGPYTGQLFLTQADGLQEVFDISLTRAAIKSSAKLGINPDKIELNYSRAAWDASQGPGFSVQLKEASGEWPLDGLGVQLLEFKGPQGSMDPQRHLSFKIDGQAAPHIWSWPPRDAADGALRHVARGGEVRMAGMFRDLAAGQYTARLRFVAANVASDGEQELLITANVRDSWLWACLCLMAAVLVAYVGTKGLQIIRDRATFRARIQTLRKQLNRLPNVQRGEAIPLGLPEVWARSVLRQAELWSHRLLLSGIDVITRRVDAAEQVIGLLRRVGELKERENELPQDTVPRFRANLGRIVRAIGAGPLSDAEKADIETRLNALEAWLNLDTLQGLYEADVNPAIQRLLMEVQTDALDGSAKKLAEQLAADLGTVQAAGQPLQETLAREKKYAMLQLIWQRRQDKELVALVDAYDASGSMEKVFALADATAWERVKQEARSEAFRFVAPNADNPIRTFEPTHFEIEPTKDSTLKQTFLFMHRLHFTWELMISPEEQVRSRLTKALVGLLTALHLRRKPKPQPPLRPVSLEPRVMQFCPVAGEMAIRVSIQYKGETVEIAGPRIHVDKSEDFLWRRAFEFAEMMALGIAAAVAVVTGLETFYLTNASFGSAKDYVSLFLWGAGVDVTKTFVQQLQAHSRQTGASAGGS